MISRQLAPLALVVAFLAGACTGTQEALPPKALAVATDDGVQFVQTVVEDGAFRNYALLPGHTLGLPNGVTVLDVDAYGARDRTLVVLYEQDENQTAVRKLAFFPIGRVAANQAAVTYNAEATLNLAELLSNVTFTADCARRVDVDPSGRYVGLRTASTLEGCERHDPLHLWFDRESDGPTFNLLWPSSGDPITQSAPAWLDFGGDAPSVTWAEPNDVKDEGVGDNGPNERRVSLERGSWAGPAKDYHAAGRVGIATDGTQLVRVDWNTGEPSDPVDRSALGIGLIDRVHVEPNLPGTFVVQGSFRGYLTDLTETSRGLSMLATDAVFDVDTLDYLHAFKGARLEAWDVIDPLNPQAVANLNLNVSGSPVGVAWFFTQAAAEP